MFRRWLILVFAVLLAAAAVPSLAANAQGADPCAAAEGEPVTIGAAYLYVEYNSTAGDLGIHGFFDDHGWSTLCVYDPAGSLMLAVTPQGELGRLGLSGVFFEGREPELEEFGPDELIAAFPEGEYTVRGMNVDGTVLAGTALFTHDVPNPPVITGPALAEDEESAGDAVMPATGMVITWDDVTHTIYGDPVTIVGYEVIVTKEGAEAPHGFSQPIFDVHVAADRNSVTISPEFLEPGALYQVEVLALEVSGNQTITEGYFVTE